MYTSALLYSINLVSKLRPHPLLNVPFSTDITRCDQEPSETGFRGRIFHWNTAFLNSFRIVRRFSTRTHSHGHFVSIGK